jgi:hypothetical protein
MKTMERSISCRNIRREIEEAGQNDPLGSSVDRHLKACSSCERFYGEQLKLRQIVSTLGTVAAPNDFEFRLRARLASEKTSVRKPFSIGNLSFGVRSTAFAALLLMGSGLLALGLRSDTDNALVANGPSTLTVNSNSPQAGDAASSAAAGEVNHQARPVAIAGNEPDAMNPKPVTDGQRRFNRTGARATQVASAGNRTREMASTPAKVIRPDELVAAGHSVFPIDASPQALKVSLDNGRGSSKTVSLPGVSFGSQRVLTQNSSPLLASSRGAW